MNKKISPPVVHFLDELSGFMHPLIKNKALTIGEALYRLSYKGQIITFRKLQDKIKTLIQTYLQFDMHASREEKSKIVNYSSIPFYYLLQLNLLICAEKEVYEMYKIPKLKQSLLGKLGLDAQLIENELQQSKMINNIKANIYSYIEDISMINNLMKTRITDPRNKDKYVTLQELLEIGNNIETPKYLKILSNRYNNIIKFPVLSKFVRENNENYNKFIEAPKMGKGHNNNFSFLIILCMLTIILLIVVLDSIYNFIKSNSSKTFIHSISLLLSLVALLVFYKS